MKTEMPETSSSSPKLPSRPPADMPMHVSLVVCERIYQAQHSNAWILSATFNEMENPVARLNPKGVGWGVPQMGIYLKVQGTKEKTIQALVGIRVVEVNGMQCDGSTALGRVDFALSKKTNFSSDAGFLTQDGLTIVTEPPTVPIAGKLNTVQLQVEAWIGGILQARLSLRMNINVQGVVE